MSRLTIEDIEKMTMSKYIETRRIKLIDEKVFGDKQAHAVEVDIFDGLAYYFNEDTKKEFYITYPKMEFIKVADNCAQNICEYMKLEDKNNITIPHILGTYATIVAND